MIAVKIIILIRTQIFSHAFMNRKHAPIDTKPNKNVAGNQISSCMTVIP